MTTLADGKTEIIAALADVAGVTMHEVPQDNPRAGDGWVTIGRVVPTGFGSACLVEYHVTICLGPDIRVAEQKYEILPVLLISAVTAVLNATDVTVEPDQMWAGTNQVPMYYVGLSLKMEVG